MRKWHYRQDSETLGPVSEDELIALLSNGTLKRESYVWTPEFEDWKRAVEVPELNVGRAAPHPFTVPPSGSGEKSQDAQKEARNERVRKLSHVIDWTIFLVLLFVFNVNFVIALVVSIGAGYLIRKFFCR